MRLYDLRLTHGSSVSMSQHVLQTWYPRPDLLSTSRVLPSIPPSAGISALDFSKDNSGEILINYREADVMLVNINNFVVDDVKNSACNKIEQIYVGRRNSLTFAKEVAFIGTGAFVGTGTDAGHVIIWDKKSGKVVFSKKGDKKIVNAICVNPMFPFCFATSGIEKSFKIWGVGESLDDNPYHSIMITPHNISQSSSSSSSNSNSSMGSSLDDSEDPVVLWDAADNEDLAAFMAEDGTLTDTDDDDDDDGSESTDHGVIRDSDNGYVSSAADDEMSDMSSNVELESSDTDSDDGSLV